VIDLHRLKNIYKHFTETCYFAAIFFAETKYFCSGFLRRYQTKGKLFVLFVPGMVNILVDPGDRNISIILPTCTVAA